MLAYRETVRLLKNSVFRDILRVVIEMVQGFKLFMTISLSKPG